MDQPEPNPSLAHHVLAFVKRMGYSIGQTSVLNPDGRALRRLSATAASDGRSGLPSTRITTASLEALAIA